MTPPPMSERHRERLITQALATMEVLRGERRRNQLQLHYLEKAKLLADQEAPTTDAALKIIEPKVFDLMNEATTVRSDFSLLDIAAS